MTTSERINHALDVAKRYGSVDGGQHKMWVIDQMVRALTDQQYAEWVKEHNQGKDGPATYAWEEGNAP